jgi:signal transduction histidine kinase
LLAGQIGRALLRRQTREEEERRARLAAIGQMIAGVLHDLRTPLTVISGYAEMLGEEDDRTVRTKFAQSILSQVDHVTSMQSETLAFVRGETSLFKRKVFLHVYLRDLEEQLKPELAAAPKPIELKLDVAYTGSAKFDESKMTRALFNLARNAIDAMPEGGKFTLHVSRQADELIFRVSDNGPGIPPEIADRLFESFVTSGKKNGTGLGLALVKKIAQEHDGTVSFKSKPGKGTTFEVRVPAGTPLE